MCVQWLTSDVASRVNQLTFDVQLYLGRAVRDRFGVYVRNVHTHHITVAVLVEVPAG